MGFTQYESETPFCSSVPLRAGGVIFFFLMSVSWASIKVYDGTREPRRCLFNLALKADGSYLRGREHIQRIPHLGCAHNK